MVHKLKGTIMSRYSKRLKKHNDCCDAMRASVGVEFGNGLKILEEMRKGTEVQKALAQTYSTMSVNMADALISLYHSNPLLASLMSHATKPKRPTLRLVK